MNILLLNNNPVVTKLVTLSAQKSSDKLEVVDGIDEISSSRYDLVVVDDSLYSEENMDELSAKVEFSKSLYICSRNAEHVESFTTILKKPFLPTDLVDIFINFGKNVVGVTGDLADKIAKNSTSGDKTNSFASDKQAEKSGGYNLDDLDISDDFDNLEVMGDLDSFDDLDILSSEGLTSDDELLEDMSDSILDKDDLKEVQNLLSETEKDEDDFELELDDEDVKNNKASVDTLEDELDFEDEELEEELMDDSKSIAKELASTEEDEDDFNLEFEDEELEDELVDDSKSTAKELASAKVEEDEFGLDFEDDSELADADELEEELDFEDDELSDNLSSIADEPKASGDFEDALDGLEDDKDDSADLEDDFEDLEGEGENIESQIEKAMQNLSEEDLQSEIDGDILLDFDSITSRDFKMAIGEEVSEDDIVQETQEITNELDEEFSEDLSHMIENEETIEEESQSDNSDGVESLKKLLAALSNEDVAASLKGMKISINITLGGK